MTQHGGSSGDWSMTSTSDGGGASAGGDGTSTLVPNHLAALVPSFDPAKDDLVAYTQKVQLLVGMWPDQKWTELATRLILNCSGSAFLKLQLQHTELTKDEKKSIQRLIEVLGGHWGQINLEKQYEYAERALYRCSQKTDETADSFLARADIMWTELISRNISLKDLQPYVTLHGSLLNSEDKKRVLLDADTAGNGKLSAEKVNAAIRLLGASFFQDMTGSKRVRGKTYDQATLVAEGSDMDEGQPTLAMESVEDTLSDGDMVEAFLTEGDEDAVLITDFENAATECMQNNEELAAALNAYTEARRRLVDKARHRGFWPVQGKSSFKGRGKFSASKGVKGKFSNKGSRKTLQQRILESRCRICDRVGHWKAECPQNPMRQNPSDGRSSGSTVPTSYVQASSHHNVIDQLPLEFLNLPAQEGVLDEPRFELVFGRVSFGNNNDPFSKLRATLQFWGNGSKDSPMQSHCNVPRNDATQLCHFDKPSQTPSIPMSETCFATHGSFGVVDLGATKTVIGSQLVGDLISNLQPHVQQQLTRCPCRIAFRFGNHGILESSQALVVPIFGLKLKIAIVPGSTPFLLSNTLLRTLGAVVDTQTQELFLKKCGKSIPLHLTPKGLFLLDLNDLVPENGTQNSDVAETHHVSNIKAAPSQPIVQESWNISVESNKSKNSPESSKPSTETSQKVHKASAETCVDSKPAANQPAVVIGSKTFARSFSFPFKHFKNVAVPKTSASPGEGRGAVDRVGAHVPHGDGTVGDRFREHPQGQDLQGDVDQGTTMGVMVREPLPELNQEEPSTVHPLCDKHGGSSRSHRPKGSSPTLREGPGCSHWQGIWQEIPCSEDSKQTQAIKCRGSRGSPERDAPAGQSGIDRLRRDGILRGGQRAGNSGDWASGKSHVEPGERSEPRHPALGSDECSATNSGRSLKLDFDRWDEAGDLSADCMFGVDSDQHINQERCRFRNLVKTISSELEECIRVGTCVKTLPPSIDILEVFCSSDSQITHQCQQLGFRASRFDWAKGDLQSSSGRKTLFMELIQKRPRHLWFAPTCGPWSNWSHLNESKSIEAWDRIHSLRLNHLSQVALGLVLLRYQRTQGRHLHWEQPRSSMMFKLPYLADSSLHDYG